MKPNKLFFQHKAAISTNFTVSFTMIFNIIIQGITNWLQAETNVVRVVLVYERDKDTKLDQQMHKVSLTKLIIGNKRNRQFFTNMFTFWCLVMFETMWKTYKNTKYTCTVKSLLYVMPVWCCTKFLLF